MSRESPASGQSGFPPLPEASGTCSVKVTDLARPLHLGTFCTASCKAKASGFHKPLQSQLKGASFPHVLCVASRRAGYPVTFTSCFWI